MLVNDQIVDVFRCGNRIVIMGYVLPQLIISYHAAENHVHVTASLTSPNETRKKASRNSVRSDHSSSTHSLSYDRSIDSAKANSPDSAI
jgi:hypothetical protein